MSRHIRTHTHIRTGLREERAAQAMGARCWAECAGGTRSSSSSSAPHATRGVRACASMFHSRTRPPTRLRRLRCTDSCAFAGDGDCDDGGVGAEYSWCARCSDCGDCGVRLDGCEVTTHAVPPSPPSSAPPAPERSLKLATPREPGDSASATLRCPSGTSIRIERVQLYTWCHDGSRVRESAPARIARQLTRSCDGVTECAEPPIETTVGWSGCAGSRSCRCGHIATWKCLPPPPPPPPNSPKPSPPPPHLPPYLDSSPSALLPSPLPPPPLWPPTPVLWPDAPTRPPNCPT